MPERPLLVFPEPTRAERAIRSRGWGRLRFPSAEQQAQRLTPQFQRLQQAMDRHRLSLQGNSLGLQPEQALVIETIGSVDRFINAIKKIAGLEWLGEGEVDEIDPDFGFEDQSDPEKKLKGQLFLIMTDQRALHELHSLFTKSRNPAFEFPRGLAPLKQAFAHLHTIRPWDAEDRIRDTGLWVNWKDRVTHGQDVVPFEVELWFRENTARQQQAAAYLASIIESLRGKIVQQCVIRQIAYHGVLGNIPISEIPELVPGMASMRDFRLLQCEDIMYLRPVGQCAIHVRGDASEPDKIEEEQKDLPHGEPIVALFDGLPLTGHRVLDGRLIVHDPDAYESTYQAQTRIHGTEMASLICHGDLDKKGEPSTRLLYVRPIMQPYSDFSGQVFERIPEDVLPVDLVHRAVRRLFENEGGEPPAAPSVRVVNLSVCDRSRPFDRGMSSWARLLDWLSWKYNILFIVSAGNHTHDIELNVPRTNLQQLSATDREKAVIMAIAEDTRHRRLLSPSETLNGITVAATHEDASTIIPSPYLFDPFARTGLPSTYSAHGAGYRRAIKPDIFLAGGRQLLSEKLGGFHAKVILQTSDSNRPPGQRVAAPGASGELDRRSYSRGTSNAAALASRWATFLYNLIEELRGLPDVDLPIEYDAILLKALLVHGADWADAGILYESILKNPQNSRILKSFVGRFLGYGSADVAKVMACTEQRVTVLGVGKLEDDEGHEFSFPLPPSLSATTEKRRLTITLSWMSPVNCKRQNYRVAHLWFNPMNYFASDRICADYRAVLRGTVQHEVLEGTKAIDFQDGDSIVIKVNCRADASDIPEPIRYALAVTLEVAEGIDLPIYQEVRDRLRVRVPIQRRDTI